ncbi:MAG: hypothetical protein NC905_03510 [Candidatus Omnitrophica bacterium]|nr:hypothetical protein [Candidatus Omnitrophota bacterium]MCM8777314.1 hypothetical protein [Candidatus Omnitrophota bacterium]
MKKIRDLFGREIRLTDEREKHIEEDHPEMVEQIGKIQETLSAPEIIIQSKTDIEVELFYRYYKFTPVGEKYLCVVVKVIKCPFLITAYFTDTIKEGRILWEKK